MADTYTTNLRLRKIEVGAKEDAWAPPSSAGLNDGVAGLLDDAIAGVSEIDVGSGDVTLTASSGVSDNQRSMFLRATGAPGTPRSITVPDTPTAKLYVVQNETDDVVTVKTVSGSGVAIPVGERKLMEVDATADDVQEVDVTGNIVTTPSAWSTVLCDIADAAAGDTQVTVRYALQGNRVMLQIPAFTSTITPGAGFTSFQLTPNTPASFPSEMKPYTYRNFPAYALVLGTEEPVWVGVPESVGADYIEIQRGNYLAGNWANATSIAMVHNIILTYGLGYS